MFIRADLFSAVSALPRLRNHVKSKTTGAREEDRLTMEWIETRRVRLALRSELDQPTSSRTHGTQAKLVEAMKVASDKCHRLVIEFRVRRKG